MRRSGRGLLAAALLLAPWLAGRVTNHGRLVRGLWVDTLLPTGKDGKDELVRLAGVHGAGAWRGVAEVEESINEMGEQLSNRKVESRCVLMGDLNQHLDGKVLDPQADDEAAIEGDGLCLPPAARPRMRDRTARRAVRTLDGVGAKVLANNGDMTDLTPTRATHCLDYVVLGRGLVKKMTHTRGDTTESPVNGDHRMVYASVDIMTAQRRPTKGARHMKAMDLAKRRATPTQWWSDDARVDLPRWRAEGGAVLKNAARRVCGRGARPRWPDSRLKDMAVKLGKVARKCCTRARKTEDGMVQELSRQIAENRWARECGETAAIRRWHAREEWRLRACRQRRRVLVRSAAVLHGGSDRFMMRSSCARVGALVPEWGAGAPNNAEARRNGRETIHAFFFVIILCQ